MITTITIRCDWPGCGRTLTYVFRVLRPDKPGWKTETDGVYSLHLCPTHAAQFGAGERPTAG